MTQQLKLAVLYHIFYEDSVNSIAGELNVLKGDNAIFLFNICSETPDKKRIIAFLKKEFPSCFIIATSNKGKDIGAKLALLEMYLQLQVRTEYLLFLHDKRSLQALKSKKWKQDLLRILTPENSKKAFNYFEGDKWCGLVAAENYVIDELVEDYHFVGINGKLLAEIIKEFDIMPRSYKFVAGTMFWAREEPIRKFFIKHNPLSIRRRLENGNVLDNFSGTITHSWERALSWIVTSQGYHIKGV